MKKSMTALNVFALCKAHEARLMGGCGGNGNGNGNNGNGNGNGGGGVVVTFIEPDILDVQVPPN